HHGSPSPRMPHHLLPHPPHPDTVAPPEQTRQRGTPPPRRCRRNDSLEKQYRHACIRSCVCQPDEHYSLVGGNLVISNPRQKKHAGTYICVAHNIYGTVISKEARVKFGCKNAFLKRRETRSLSEKARGCSSAGLLRPTCLLPSEEVSYRWIFNEFPVFLNMDRRRFVSQRTGNLYISKVEAQDAGNYSCFVSSPVLGKSVFSKFIPLIPLPPDDGEFDRYLCKKATLIKVEVPMRLLECRGVTQQPCSESGAALHLYNVQYEDVGAYECEAINTKGKDWHKAWLYVECERLPRSGKGELKFSSLTFADSGMYQCIAENYWGIKYANAELRVIACAPTFEFNPLKKQLLGARDGRVLIECKPRAAPRPRFTWSKGKELLFNSSRISIMFDGTLEILNATKNDEGFYTCFAENDRGKANSSGYLTITGQLFEMDP
uniref:Contactin 1b n=1 Tax=Hippocampus comes TaxID=109280 RepID=A0A3Q2YRM7_HIPCM